MRLFVLLFSGQMHSGGSVAASPHQKLVWHIWVWLLARFTGIMLLRVRGGGGFEELRSLRTIKEGYCMVMSGNANLEVPFGLKRAIFDPGNVNIKVRAGEVANSHIGVSSSHIWPIYLAVSTLRCSNPPDFLSFLLSSNQRAGTQIRVHVNQPSTSASNYQPDPQSPHGTTFKMSHEPSPNPSNILPRS